MQSVLPDLSPVLAKGDDVTSYAKIINKNRKTGKENNDKFREKDFILYLLCRQYEMKFVNSRES